jgi:hypothetical protein
MSGELLRNQNFGAGPDAAVDEFDVPVSTSEGNVDVVHGVFAHTLPLAGMTVRQARGELAERMNIDPEAIGFVDGNEVDEDTILAEGQVLNFVKHAGEKGRA